MTWVRSWVTVWPSPPSAEPSQPRGSFPSCSAVCLMLPVKCVTVTLHSQPLYIWKEGGRGIAL